MYCTERGVTLSAAAMSLRPISRWAFPWNELDCPAQRPGLRGSVSTSPALASGYTRRQDPKPPRPIRRADTICHMTERIEVQRTIAAPAADIFAVLCDPQGHVAIDATGMLQDAEGDPVRDVGDTFVVHMDREALNDYPLGKYDVTVSIRDFDKDRLIAWTILGRSARRSATCTAITSSRPTMPPWSRRSTTGPISTSIGATPTFFRSFPKARCAPPSESSTARCVADIPAASAASLFNG